MGTASAVTLARRLAPLASAADTASAVPVDTAFRTALCGVALAELYGRSVSASDVYFGALLRHLGCSASSHEETRLMGDERELRSSMAVADAGSPASMFAAARRGFGEGKGGLERARRVARFMLGAPRQAARIFAGRCEVATQLATRLGLPASVAQVLNETYERFDGKGVPEGKRGDAIRPEARILAAAEMIATCAGLPGGVEMARDLLQHRSGSQFEPELVALCLRHWPELMTEIAGGVRERVFEREPPITASVDLDDADAFALVFADFVDLKSPYTLGHSRSVSTLAHDAASELGLPKTDQARLRTAGLLHDLGRLSVSNAIWDKPGALGDAEREAVRGHAVCTERMLSQSDAWQSLAVLAACDHERTDGSGYPRGAYPANAGLPARLLAAADVLAALVEPRSHRPARTVDDAARALRQEASRGRLERAAVDAVLACCGLARRGERAQLPRGITERELEVLRLLVRGLVDKEIARKLGISHRTVHHHNQSLFQKIGVTTRGAAALFATENGLI